MGKILIAGPCVGENSVQWLIDQAGAIHEALSEGPGIDTFDWIFKCSFDKANRTERYSYRGLGLDKTLEAFQRIKELYGCRVTTDVHEVWQTHEVKPVVDVIQIPAMLSRQTDIITSAARNALTVNIKLGTTMSVASAGAALRKVDFNYAENAWVTYRGTAFGSELVFDPNRIWELGGYASTVIADVTHSSVDWHNGRLVNARVAAALDVDGLFIECHPDPENALSDGNTQHRIDNLAALLEGLTWAK